MTPDQARAVMLAAPVSDVRGLTLLDVAGLDGDRVQVLVELAGVGRFTAEVPVPGPLPLAPGVLLELVAELQSRVGAVSAVFETDVGRGFNEAGRGALPVAQGGFGANDGWV